VDRFEDFCRRFHSMLSAEGASGHVSPRAIRLGRELVSELTSQPDWFLGRLKTLVLDPTSLDGQRPGIWPNEFTLYRCPDKSFVVLAYVWEPGLADTIHDHGAWGVIGTVLGTLRETRYERVDGRDRDDYCELREQTSALFSPGQATVVLPLDAGLHAMDNPTEMIAASINVYGRSLGRGYTRFFDPVAHTITRVFPPRTAQLVLAAEAMAAADPEQARRALREALNAGRPAPVRREYERIEETLRV
jgi:predicted metal-dependent enzyme (double-stranded beta helix superfamily)